MMVVLVTSFAICPQDSPVCMAPDADAAEVGWLLSAVTLGPDDMVSICAVATDKSAESAAMDLMVSYCRLVNSVAGRE